MVFLKGNKAWDNDNSKTHLFQKGHEVIEGTEKTRFKKGLIPWNYIDGRSRTRTTGRYGDDWDKIRYLIYMRDRFTCQHCGIKGRQMHVHHIIPFLISFNNQLNNLITLCGHCHRIEETRIMKELKKQEVISR